MLYEYNAIFQCTLILFDTFTFIEYFMIRMRKNMSLKTAYFIDLKG